MIIFKNIILLLTITTSLFCESIIAVKINNKVDIDSVKLIQKLSKQDQNLTNFTIKITDNPLQEVFNNQACFAISTGDILYNLNNNEQIKSILAIHPNYLKLMVSSDLNISHLSDIKDKNIHIALANKSIQNITNLLINKLELKNSIFKILDQNTTNKYEGYLDFIPSNSNYNTNSDFIPIPLAGKLYAQLIRLTPYLLKGSIDKKLYKNQNHDIVTIGLKSILITNTKCDKKAIYDITKLILNNLEKFKKIHYVYHNISKKILLEELVIPQDKEAIKAFNNIKESI